MEYIVQTEGLTKDFGRFCLEDISLSLPGGVILGLIGENGAGKSTLIKCLLGLLTPTAGACKLALPGGLAEVGYVPDECPFDKNLTLQQVEAVLAGIFADWDNARWEQLIEQFQLPREGKVKELSRGMGMKLSIAAALAHHPKLLVLDEATAGLDPVVRDEILDVFLDFVCDEEHAVLLSSHITSDLEKVCDYVAYLHKGRLTVFGEKDELLMRYAILRCSREALETLDRELLVGTRIGAYGAQALVSDRETFRRRYPELPLDGCTLEDIMIFTTRGEEQ